MIGCFVFNFSGLVKQLITRIVVWRFTQTHQTTHFFTFSCALLHCCKQSESSTVDWLIYVAEIADRWSSWKEVEKVISSEEHNARTSTTQEEKVWYEQFNSKWLHEAEFKDGLNPRKSDRNLGICDTTPKNLYHAALTSHEATKEHTRTRHRCHIDISTFVKNL